MHSNLDFIDRLLLSSRTVESGRSLSVKADDPKKDESGRSGTKADDPWVKADDPGWKQTIFGLKQTIFWAKPDDLWVKADDPEPKQTISRAENRRSGGSKRTILSEIQMCEFHTVKEQKTKY